MNSRFSVIEVSDDMVMIRFVRWSGRGDIAASLNRSFYADQDGGELYFCIEREQFVTSSTVYANRGPVWQASIIAMPIKLRPGYGRHQFSFDSDVSISFGIGGTFPLTDDVSVGLVVGVGTSLIRITDETDAARSFGAFTVAAGGFISISNVQISLLVGTDLLADRGDVYWRHHGRPWFGIALGAGIFNGTRAAEAQKPS